MSVRIIEKMKSKVCRMTWLGALAALLVMTTLGASGCGDTSANNKTDAETTGLPTATVEPRWPDVPVTNDSVQAATKQILGYQVAPKIPTVRSANATETSPGHFQLTVNYNQPGMCHTTGTSTWQVTILQQYAFSLAYLFYKQPQIDRLEMEVYATADPNIDDPQKFEKVARFVIERSKADSVTWEAPRAYATLPNFATEYWVTPKAK